MNELVGSNDGYSIQKAITFQWSSISGELDKERIRFLQQHVIGPRVLDAGCGGGGYVDFLVRNGFEAVGVDKYDIFLARARAKGYLGKFIQADLNEKLPFADKSFDTTCCMDVLEHIDDQSAIRELARVTRKRLIIMVPLEDKRLRQFGLVLFTYQDPTHLRYYNRESIQELASLIAPCSVKLTEQVHIDLKKLVQHMLKPESRRPVLQWIYRRLFNFLLLRCHDPSIFMNIAAVIDFEQ
jgi:SAM-dependent methyltransferase